MSTLDIEGSYSIKGADVTNAEPLKKSLSIWPIMIKEGMDMTVSESFDETRIALLQDKETAALYVEEALSNGDMDAFKLALKHIAQVRSGGIVELAKKSGLSREQLYRTLSPKGS